MSLSQSTTVTIFSYRDNDADSDEYDPTVPTITLTTPLEVRKPEDASKAAKPSQLPSQEVFSYGGTENYDHDYATARSNFAASCSKVIFSNRANDDYHTDRASFQKIDYYDDRQGVQPTLRVTNPDPAPMDAIEEEPEDLVDWGEDDEWWDDEQPQNDEVDYTAAKSDAEWQAACNAGPDPTLVGPIPSLLVTKPDGNYLGSEDFYAIHRVNIALEPLLDAHMDEVQLLSRELIVLHYCVMLVGAKLVASEKLLGELGFRHVIKLMLDSFWRAEAAWNTLNEAAHALPKVRNESGVGVYGAMVMSDEAIDAVTVINDIGETLHDVHPVLSMNQKSPWLRTALRSVMMDMGELGVSDAIVEAEGDLVLMDLMRRWEATGLNAYVDG